VAVLSCRFFIRKGGMTILDDPSWSMVNAKKLRHQYGGINKGSIYAPAHGKDNLVRRDTLPVKG
jgi:hypothetical protein